MGGYTDWLRQRPQAKTTAPTAAARPAAETSTPAPKRKLSYKEQRELESLPAEIQKLEDEQRELTRRMSADDYHRTAAEEMRRDGERAVEIEALLAQRMERWVSLEEKA